MRILLDNWQLILVTAALNMLIAYLIFDSPLSKRWNEGIASRESGNKSLLGRYTIVVAYSVLLTVTLMAVDSTQGSFSPSGFRRLISSLLLAASLILIPELFIKSRRFLITFLFIEVTAFASNLLITLF